MKGVILLVAMAMACNAEQDLGAEYAHFSKMPMLPREHFHLLVNGFFTNWHLQQTNNAQEKQGVLDSLGQTVQTAIGQSGTIGRILSSTMGALNVVTNLKSQISNPGSLVSNLGGSLLNQGLSKIFGRRLEDADGVFSGITNKVQEAQGNQQTIDSTLRTVDKGIGMIKSASNLFFNGQGALGSIKNFFGFSLAQLEKQAASTAHLSATPSRQRRLSDIQATSDALRAGLRYLASVQGQADLGDLEFHMFGARAANPGLLDLINMSLVENAEGDLRVNTRPFSHREEEVPDVVTDLTDYHPIWLPSGGINIAVRP